MTKFMNSPSVHWNIISYTWTPLPLGHASWSGADILWLVGDIHWGELIFMAGSEDVEGEAEDDRSQRQQICNLLHHYTIQGKLLSFLYILKQQSFF